MDLYIDLNYEGKLKKAGNRSYSDYYHAYCTSKARIRPKRHLEIKADDFYCRDELIPAICANIKNFTTENKLVSELSAEDRTLRFELNTLYFSNSKLVNNDDVNRYAQLLQIALMGETNENFSLAASPYLVRYAVQRLRDWPTLPQLKRDRILAVDGRSTLSSIRAAIGWNDWFWNTMIAADEKGIRLNPDMQEAWQLETDCAFGHMGLDLLKLQSQPRVGEKRAFDKWFPPITSMRKRAR